MNVLVTGASGFIGRALIARLLTEPMGNIRAAVRTPNCEFPSKIVVHPVGDLSRSTDWRLALSGIDVVIHTAARVHILRGKQRRIASAFLSVNVDGTLNLARQAAQSGVRRLIYISSVKVNGEGRGLDQPYTAEDAPNPCDPYAASKMAAEEGLRQIASATGLEVVILRPPLVYGPGVKANFFNLMKLVDRKVPLPLASINNRRSLIYSGNLVDAILKGSEHPLAAGKTFLLSDGEDLSTPDLIRHLALAMDRPVRLFSVPPFLLGAVGKLPSPFRSISKLTDNLTLDNSGITAALGWMPPYGIEEGIGRTVAWYKSCDSKGISH